MDRERSWQREKKLRDNFVAALGMETSGREAIECKNGRGPKMARKLDRPVPLST